MLTSVGFGLALFYLIVSYIPLPINIAIASEFMLSVFTGIPAIVLSAFFLLLSLMSLFIHF